MKFLAICDPHFSPKNPAAWTSSYEEFNFYVWDQFFDYAAREKVQGLLVAGDVFHRKREQDLAFLLRLSKFLYRSEDAPCVYAIPGNHDLLTGSVVGGLEGTAYEMLDMTDAIANLDHGEFPRECYLGSLKEDLLVRISGAGYDHGSADRFLDVPTPEKDAPDFHIRLGHFNFSLEPRDEFFGEKVYSPDDLGSPADVVVVGHHHHEQGFTRANGTTWVAPGSSTWTSRHTADKDRRLAAALITLEKGQEPKVQLIRPKVPPIEDLINTQVRDQIQEESSAVSDYVSSLASAEFETEDPKAVADGLDLEAEVRSKAVEYLEAAENA